MSEAKESSLTFDRAVGHQLGRLRRDQGRSQEEVARTMRLHGLDWTRSTVSRLEAGERTLTVPEMWLLRRELGFPIMQSSDDPIAVLNDASMMKAQGLLAGERRTRALSDVGEAEQKAARKLSMPVERLATMAASLWGRSLAEERDRRLGDTDVISERTAQARRGHITRRLIAELAEVLERQNRRSARPKKKGSH
jgi:transcriptional regulator with XRE-family HTH domain